jgi:hypothetical protein
MPVSYSMKSVDISVSIPVVMFIGGIASISNHENYPY